MNHQPLSDEELDAIDVGQIDVSVSLYGDARLVFRTPDGSLKGFYVNSRTCDATVDLLCELIRKVCWCRNEFDEIAKARA